MSTGTKCGLPDGSDDSRGTLMASLVLIPYMLIAASPIEEYAKVTARLARRLRPVDIYKWLVTDGYFPEAYVLPPCFKVTRQPRYGKRYSGSGRKFNPKITEYLQVSFPKTDYTDRTFGVIDPEIHSDISLTIAQNWKGICDRLFNASNRVVSYSFPIPISAGVPGRIGHLRTGRMIYEFIEMAENHLAAVAYKYECLITTDIKNFYPSIYTHSIAWAMHGKRRIRRGRNRFDYTFCGNRLDKLFQNANDGCTNGVPIGPVVSDIIAELILASVDRELSDTLERRKTDVVVVRFKDDYRILAHAEQHARSAVKALQSALKLFRLELNDDKTECHTLPDGLFRPWVSDYHTCNPRPKVFYHSKRFKETFLAVVAIDKARPNTGIIDRFLSDLIRKNYSLRFSVSPRTLPKVVSLLLTLGRLRTKAFPKVLAILAEIVRSPQGYWYAAEINNHLNDLLADLCVHESENRYLIAWVLYFLRAYGKLKPLGKGRDLVDPIVRSVYTSRFTAFGASRDFKIFQGVMAAAKKKKLLQHLSVFAPQ